MIFNFLYSKAKNNKMRLLVGVVFLFSDMSLVHAKKKKKKIKKTSITFEDELIEGDVKKPDLFYLLEKKKFNYKKLIKLRENFIPEMTRSAENIPSKGGDK